MTAMIGALTVPVGFIVMFAYGTVLNATCFRPVSVTPWVAKHRRTVTA
jgi:hypothetical protein